ncbi:hypothetical protein niasHT_035875 [Heterodera trifolii]|uniref:Uncharacterized protein n=1 Tax=Heterodera trifolii TaxID=157864 RepID=A0ABD2ID45_9BILA
MPSLFFTVLVRFSPHSVPINLVIKTDSDRILEFSSRNIWPMIAKNILPFACSSTSHSFKSAPPTIAEGVPRARALCDVAPTVLYLMGLPKPEEMDGQNLLEGAIYINDSGLNTNSDRILETIFRNVWPMIVKHIRAIQLSATVFRRLRHFVPSILADCPSLRLINAYDYGFFAEFPADDSAAASDGQAMAKWLFTPLQNDVPKVFKCWLHWDDGNLASRIEGFKAAFSNASSPVNFIVVVRFPPSFAASVVPFDLTNELTHEQLTLKRIVINIGRFLLIRCPIERHAHNWANWEKEAIGWSFLDQWNRIDIRIS